MPNRSRHPACPRCLTRGEPCLCAEVPRIEARLRVVIVRHAAERKKPTGSARWAALALGCEVVDYAATSAPFDGSALPLEGAWLLYPGGETAQPAEPPRTLIVPDGTWQQSRRMVARVPELRALPRLALPPPPPGPRLRRPHDPSGMSTLEAIAAALEVCGEPIAAFKLRSVHAAVIRRAERLRGTVRVHERMKR